MTKKRVLVAALLLAAGALIAQQAANIFRVLPATNSSGVPTSAGELRFLDLTNPGSGTPHYWGFKAPNSLSANYVFTGPSMTVGHTTGCWTSDGSLVITLDPTCSSGGYPVKDTVFALENNADTTKQLIYDLSGITTATTRIWTVPDASMVVAGSNISQTWYNTQNCDSGTGAFQAGGVLWFRCSDKTLWGLGDFNTAVTMSADNTWDFGTGAKRIRTLEAVTLRTRNSASSTQACESTGAHLRCLDSTGATWCEIISSTASFQCQVISGFTTTVSIVASSGAATFGAITGSSVKDTALAGTGNRDICADSTGTIVLTSCPSTGSVTSIATSSPISGGTITTTGTISCPTCAVTNTGQTFSGNQTFSGDINCSSSSNFNGNGTLMIRCSDRTLWNLGDFNSVMTMSADNTWDFGSAAKRVRTIEAVTARTRSAASSSQFCEVTGSHVQCTPGNGNWCQILASTGDFQCQTISGFVTTASIIASTGNASFTAVTANGNAITDAIVGSSGGKKITAGSACMSSGSNVVSTGLSSVTALTATYENNGTPSEDIEADTPSGGSVTVRSSNTGSGSCFRWIAFGS